MATDRDPYRVLGLARSTSQAEITSAYRRRLREHHPDTRTPHRPDPAADEDLQRILSAYALLRDREHRARHDRAVTDRAVAEPDTEPRRQSRAPSQAATPIRIRVVGPETPPPRHPPATGLWVGPVRWQTLTCTSTRVTRPGRFPTFRGRPREPRWQQSTAARISPLRGAGTRLG